MRIEFEVEDDVAILSLFDAWHCVLNGCYLVRDEGESRLMEKRLAAGQLKRVEVRKSWERIFDLSFGSATWWGGLKQRSVQACVGELRLDWVRDVTHFTAR